MKGCLETVSVSKTGEKSSFTPMVTPRNAMEEQTTEKDLRILAVNVCNWIFFLKMKSQRSLNWIVSHFIWLFNILSWNVFKIKPYTILSRGDNRSPCKCQGKGHGWYIRLQVWLARNFVIFLSPTYFSPSSPRLV